MALSNATSALLGRLDLPTLPEALPLPEMARALLLSPEKVTQAYLGGRLPHEDVLLKSAFFAGATALLFALGSVLSSPLHASLPLWSNVLRFFILLGLGLIVFPLLGLACALLQRMAAWFWDVPLSFSQVLGLSGLNGFYTGVLFVLALPLILCFHASPTLLQSGLMICYLGALGASLRFWIAAYQAAIPMSFGKALWVTVSPMVVLLLLGIATQLLASLAAMHHTF